jgi:hypothetical protein
VLWPRPESSAPSLSKRHLLRDFRPADLVVLYLQRNPSTFFEVFDSLAGASEAGSPGYIPGGIYVATPNGPIGGRTTYIGSDSIYSWLHGAGCCGPRTANARLL